MFTKLGRHEVLMVPYKCCCFLARSVQGRIQGRVKIGHRGSPSSTNSFRLEGYSNKSNAQQLSKSMWDVVLLLMVPFQVKFLTRFRHLFGLIVILPYFNAISVDFYAVKCLIYIYFVLFPCL